MRHFEFEFVSEVSYLSCGQFNFTTSHLLGQAFLYRLMLNKESLLFVSLQLILHSIFQVIEYEVGDVVEVLPSQDPAAVNAFIQRCNLDAEAFITVNSTFLFD